MEYMKNYKELLNELPSRSVVFTFGRFNPPTLGHELLVKVVRKVAKQKRADHIVFVSSVEDSKKNPLDINKKLQYLSLMFPNTKFVPVKNEAEALSAIGKYKHITLVTSSDRADYFKKSCKQITDIVISSPKDPDLDDKVRQFASKGNFLSFKNALPTSTRDLDSKRLMNDIRSRCGIEPIKEQIKLVKDTLREEYFQGKIFNEGDIVESNGLVYQIVKRGSNHLLLQNESGEKVTKWIQDVQNTERKFMQNIIKEDGDTSKQTVDLAAAKGSKDAEKERKMLELKASQAKAVEDLKARQARETQAAKVQFKTSVAEGAESPVVNTNSKYNLARSVMSLSDYRKMVGQHHGEEPGEHENNMDSQPPLNLGQKEQGHTMAVDVYGHQHRRMKDKYKVHAEEAEDFSDLEQLFLESEDEELVEFTVEELINEAYEDDELMVLDEETEEELDLGAEDKTLMEVLSRYERLKSRARFRRTQQHRQQKEKIAVRRLSTPEVANRRARRMAVSAMKKRLLKGRKPQQISVGEKERVERFIQQRRKIVDRLATRMVSRVKQVERSRMQGKRYNKPNNGATF